MCDDAEPVFPKELFDEESAGSYQRYLAWWRERDGWRNAINKAAIAKAGSFDKLVKLFCAQTKKDKQATERAVGARPSKEPVPTWLALGERRGRESLKAFFDHSEDLDPRYIASLLRCINASENEVELWDGQSPQFDVFHEAWHDKVPSPVLGKYGMRLTPLHPAATSRSINAYRRSWDTKKPAKGNYYSSPGSGACLALNGRCSLRFLRGRKPVVLEQGEVVLYSFRHPHRVVPAGSKTVLVDVSGSYRGGIPAELFLREYKAEGFLEPKKKVAGFLPIDTNPENEAFGLDSVRYMTSFVIAGARMHLRELGERCDISEGRLRRLLNGTGIPKQDEVRVISQVCRVPEQGFYRPFSKYLEESVVDKPFNVLGPLPKKKLEGDRSNEDCKLYSIGSPPSIAFKKRSSLEVSVLKCTGPDDSSECIFKARKGGVSEELLYYVVQGELGAKLVRRDGVSGARGETQGVLKEGSALWFNSDDGIKHSFWAPKGEARALVFRWLYPRPSGVD